MRWKLKGETLTMRAEGQESKGTLEDDVITMKFYGVDITMTFVKEGAALPTMEPTTEQPVTEPATEQPATESTTEVTTTPSVDFSAYQDFWAGDWYGWWYVTDAGGEWANFEGYCTDACALLEVYDDDTGYFAAWNETNIAGEAFCTCDVSFSDGVTDAGCMVSENGSFFAAGGIGHADWVIDPGDSTDFEQMVCISGHYVDPQNPRIPLVTAYTYVLGE